MKKNATVVAIMACFVLTVLCTVAFGWSERTNVAPVSDTCYDAQFFIY